MIPLQLLQLLRAPFFGNLKITSHQTLNLLPTQMWTVATGWWLLFPRSTLDSSAWKLSQPGDFQDCHNLVIFVLEVILIASTISSWMCLAHLSSYFLSSASSLKKKIMFVLDKSSSDSSEFITLLFGDLVCYYTLPCSLCTAASSASAARWSINIGPWFLSCQGGQGSWLSCGPHFTYPLHLYLNFLSLFNITESFQSFLAFF